MKVPGVEVPTGALGHGLSVAVGMAIAGKRDGAAYRVFTLMGDGEQAEGSVWEAAMSAAHYGLDNLTAIIDYNKLQISGNVDTVMRISSLRDRWTSFGWHVVEVDGNDIAALEDTFDHVPMETGRPTLVIAHTIKGKGVSFIENQASWHHHVPTKEQLEQAIMELDRELQEVER
jgi:transketolase